MNKLEQSLLQAIHEARELVREDYAYSRNFFAGLAKGLALD
jgi:hypothetical protein